MASFFQNLFGTTANITDPSVVKTYSSTGILNWFGFAHGATPRPTQENILETTAVLACVKVISEDVAKLPIRLMTREHRGDKLISKTNPRHWADKLIKNPNSYMTQFELIEFIILNCLLGRGALLIKVRVGDQIRELHPVVDGAWVMEILADQSKQFRVTFSNGGQQIFPEKDVVFFRGMSLDGRIGIDILDKARGAVGISTSLERQHINTASNMSRPSGVLSFTEPLDPERKVALRNAWQEKFGSGGTGGVAILDANATFSPMSLSLADSQFIEARRFQINEICRIFRVSSHLVMHDDKTSTYSSVEVANRSHFVNCLLPWVTRIEQTLDKDILNNSSDHYFDIDESLMLRGSNMDTAEWITKLLGAGGTPQVMTVNEAREYLGLNMSNDSEHDKLHSGGYNQTTVEPQKPEDI